MITNHFKRQHDLLCAHMPELAQHWPLAPLMFEVVEGMFKSHGKPSRCFKYSDYAAIHYTYFKRDNFGMGADLKPNKDMFRIIDHMMVMFPGDTDIHTYMIAHAGFEIEVNHPSYRKTVEEALDGMDLSDGYQEHDRAKFSHHLHTQQRHFKVEYHSGGGVVSSSLNTIWDYGSSPSQNVYRSAIEEDLHKFHGLPPFNNED